jgi:hypothetical protein
MPHAFLSASYAVALRSRQIRRLIKDSGEIEQDADSVLMLYRELLSGQIG